MINPCPQDRRAFCVSRSDVRELDIMDDIWSYEQKALTSELIRGMEFAKQLWILMMATAAPDETTGDTLIRGIMSSFEKALLVLKWNGPVTRQCDTQHVASAPGIPESPLSVIDSPHSNDLEKVHEQFQNRDLSKKRKMQPKWNVQVRVNPQTGLEGPHDDGHNWRKYGQKDILGAKYPRSYYRCTYRNMQNCWATKQVQRSDEDPTVFEITYRGAHTCAPAAPVSPEKQEIKQTDQNNGNKQQQQQQPLPEEALLRLKSRLRVNTSDSDSNEIATTYQPFSFPSSAPLPIKRNEFHNSSSLMDIVRSGVAESFSHSFLSPSTPESNYFPGIQREVSEFGQANMVQYSDSDRTEIFSANTSSNNSPILDLDFLLDQVGIDSHFPFDTTLFS